jgi:hypothetical protein
MTHFDLMLINVAAWSFADGFLLATFIFLIRKYRKLPKPKKPPRGD